MSKRYAQIVILAEDERSANLLRRYVLRALDVDNRSLRQIFSPAGQGDAKQWVLSRYPLEVKELRGRHPMTALVIHVDADRQTVAHRATQLAAALKNSGQADRAEDERISHAIPKRHTETWLCALTGLTVDEERDCKRDRVLPDFDAVVTQAAAALFGLTRPNAPAAPLPSLAAAVPELRRLEK